MYLSKYGILFDHFWRKDSNFIRYKMNFHAKIIGFGAKIKIGKKLRNFEQCVAVTLDGGVSHNYILALKVRQGCSHFYARWHTLELLNLHHFFLVHAIASEKFSRMQSFTRFGALWEMDLLC